MNNETANTTIMVRDSSLEVQLDGLEPFQQYMIEVAACQDQHLDRNERWRQYCSYTTFTTARTMPSGKFYHCTSFALVEIIRKDQIQSVDI